jgi:hypothetical protein
MLVTEAFPDWMPLAAVCAIPRHPGLLLTAGPQPPPWRLSHLDEGHAQVVADDAVDVLRTVTVGWGWGEGGSTEQQQQQQQQQQPQPVSQSAQQEDGTLPSPAAHCCACMHSQRMY